MGEKTKKTGADPTTPAVPAATAVPLALPFPTSLCHGCAAPPRYVTSGKGSTFVLCPIGPTKYPPQPVHHCPLYRKRSESGT